ncbi:MAG: heavy-metal-associated domain-containing protein [Verrucomicrobiaceae bacterium]|nr:heavy-metal-associated domain-containing protein [Verrucomicrobiaceae bacterium]
MNLPQTFPLTGMSCGSCVSKITARLQEHPDIIEANVTLTPPQAQIITRTALSPTEVNDWLRPLGKYQVTEATSPSVPSTALPPKSAQTYKPLLILLAYLLLVILAASVARGHFDLTEAMRLFMGGFFIAFSFFKMLDLRGFADAYRSYDLVAKVWPGYGIVYPFIELGLGLAYLADTHPLVVNAITATVMAVSLAGVLRAVFSNRAIRCACLGTVFQLPMSTVTIIEDGLMLLMAVFMLFPTAH